MKKNYLLIILLFLGFSVSSQTEKGERENKKSNKTNFKDAEIKGFRLYPNPVSNGVINITTFSNDKKTIQVYNVLGKQLINRKIKTNRLTITSLKPGVYILKVTENSKTATRKLVVK